MSTEKIKKELVWIRQFIHKQNDENVVIRDANGKDIASWIDRVDAAIATPPAAQRLHCVEEQDMSIEAMKQALEALENLQGLCSEESGFVEQVTIWTPDAIYALRIAIAAAKEKA